MLTPSLMHHLSIVPDFRQAWKVQHQLSDILFLTVCAVICGAEGWDEIEDFGHAKLDFLRQYGDSEASVPSHDTLARVMALVNAEQLQRIRRVDEGLSRCDGGRGGGHRWQDAAWIVLPREGQRGDLK